MSEAQSGNVSGQDERTTSAKERTVADARIAALEEFSNYCNAEYEAETEKHGAYGAQKVRAALRLAAGLATEQANIFRAALGSEVAITQQVATRPQPLTRTGVGAPDGRPFPWGPIDAVHSISGIDVVEYRCDMSDLSASQPEVWLEHGQTRFHPYIDGRDTSRSYHSLDSAVVGAIALRRVGPNSEAAHHFDLITLGELPGGIHS